MTEKTLIDFNNLDAGTIVGDQFAASGVRISNINADGSVNTNNPPMIFDAEQDPSGRVSGGDDDLLKEGAGGILIASEDGDSSDPDDNAGGACFRFDFESTTSVNSITMVDVERGAVIEVFDADGNLLKRLDVRTEDGEHVDFDIDVDGAAYMLVGINGSGGVDNLAFTPALQPDGIVNGTAQGELIETGFTDEQGDKIDSNDALGVEGTTGDDDLVLAGAGDDTVRAAEGDDIIRGEEGNDSLEGQNGDDTIEGGEGADTLIGGRGNDMLDGGSENDIIGGGSGDDMATGGDGNDRLVMGSGDDKADGEDGNDLVRGEAGEDTLFGGAGDDTVDGGSDDDLIYGDSNGQDGEPICGPRESFNWSEIDGYAEGVAVTTASQNTGTVEVTFSTLSENGGVTTEFEDDQIAVNGIDSGSETINDTSSLFSDLRNNGDNVTYEFDFATAVKGVSFNIADVDGNSVVTVRAFDADGNATDVVLEGGSKVDIDGNVADSQGGFSPDTDEDYAVNVAIDGPVSRIEILHAQDANGASGITVSDVFFDPIIGFTDEDGNDSLIGGDGADTIFGEGGDDTLDGGDGADELSGGDDQDTFVNVSVGDLIDGNEGGVDLDTLDLTGANAQVEFDDDNQENGTIFFLDGDGQRVDGDTARFLNIENVVGAVPINDDPDAVNDSVTLDEDTTVVIRPLDNDTDGNGDTLTITDVSDPANGTLVDNGDGTFTYEPNADFNGSDSFTYTVSDGNGGTDTATVNITVNPVNDDPVAETDTVSVDEDDSVVIDVLANDTDVD
ncbi:tandem-95 repeat protein, partial [Jannaschia pagri]